MDYNPRNIGIALLIVFGVIALAYEMYEDGLLGLYGYNIKNFLEKYRKKL